MQDRVDDSELVARAIRVTSAYCALDPDLSYVQGQCARARKHNYPHEERNGNGRVGARGGRGMRPSSASTRSSGT